MIIDLIKNRFFVFDPLGMRKYFLKTFHPSDHRLFFICGSIDYCTRKYSIL